MAKAIERLRQEHNDLAKLLAAFERQMGIFRSAEKPDYDIIEQVVEYCRDYPELHHHRLEDAIYRRLVERAPEAAERVGNLENDHERLAELTGQLHDMIEAVMGEGEVSREAFADFAERYVEAYRRHMAAEEGEFFPTALRVLTAEDWQAIETEIPEVLDPLNSENPEEARFARLCRHIMQWDWNARGA